MLKLHVRYCNENGDVAIYRDASTFSVFRQTVTGAGTYRCRVRSFHDLELAIDEYHAQIDVLNGVLPARKCAFYARRHNCSAKNCPKSIGGADFWTILRESCPHRTR